MNSHLTPVILYTLCSLIVSGIYVSMNKVMLELINSRLALTNSRRLKGKAQGCAQDNISGRRSPVVSPGKNRAKYRADEVSEVDWDDLLRSSSSKQDIISL